MSGRYERSPLCGGISEFWRVASHAVWASFLVKSAKKQPGDDEKARE
jgi:hypothetical protein